MRPFATSAMASVASCITLLLPGVVARWHQHTIPTTIGSLRLSFRQSLSTGWLLSRSVVVPFCNSLSAFLYLRQITFLRTTRRKYIASFSLNCLGPVSQPPSLYRHGAVHRDLVSERILQCLPRRQLLDEICWHYATNIALSLLHFRHPLVAPRHTSIFPT